MTILKFQPIAKLFNLFAFLTALALFPGCIKQQETSNRKNLDHYQAKTLFTHQGKTADGRFPESYVAVGKKGMVASEGEPATQIAASFLKRGGSAIDAAIALSFAISVYRPHSTGIGGGGFLVVYNAKKKQTVVVDMRERAPNAATEAMYVKDGKVVPDRSTIGALSVAVPGLVAGLYDTYEKYASKKFSWKELIEPSIELARKGFSVHRSMAGAIERWIVKKDILNKFPETKKLLTNESGTPLKVGDWYKNENLARTLEIIAEKGRDGFYKGKIAKAIVASVKARGGILTTQDLKQYQVKYRTPVTGTYRGYEIVSMPAPSSGGIHVIQMLNMLENNPKVLAKGFDSVESLHLKAEVMRRAYADRSEFLGDPDFFNVPTKGLTSKAYAKKLTQKIQLDKASKSKTDVLPGKPREFEKTSTTHFSIIDAEGTAVSSTQTINYYFGSGMVAGDTGIFLNDEMDDFSAQPGVPNAYGLIGGEANKIEPQKTPLSSMTPTIVLKDGKPFLILGSPGGSRIITAVLNVIINVIDHGMSLKDAVFSPRIHQQWLPDKVFIDPKGLVPETLQNLKAKGHVIEERNTGIGNVSAVLVQPDGTFVGVSDPRREGKPLGID